MKIKILLDTMHVLLDNENYICLPAATDLITKVFDGGLEHAGARWIVSKLTDGTKLVTCIDCGLRCASAVFTNEQYLKILSHSVSQPFDEI
ncbi:MAG: hypothetical protein ACRCW9_05940 [Cetobacterium sp.]